MGFASFYYRQLTDHPTPLHRSVSLTGQTAILTGSNVGLGLEAACQLVTHGCERIVLAVRNRKQAEEARSTILKGNEKCQVDIWDLDYNDFKSIDAFAKRARELPRLDIVGLNAGVMQRKYVRSPAGHELQLQVNFLATALLSLLLLPVLQQSAAKFSRPGRMTITTSEMHEWTEFKQRSAPNLFAKLDDDASFSPENYNVSKLLLVMWVAQLATKVAADQVVVSCANPGLCWSKLHRDMDSAGLRVFKRTCAWTAVEGGYCLTNAMVAHDGQSHGKYISYQKISPLVSSLWRSCELER